MDIININAKKHYFNGSYITVFSIISSLKTTKLYYSKSDGFYLDECNKEIGVLLEDIVSTIKKLIKMSITSLKSLIIEIKKHFNLQ